METKPNYFIVGSFVLILIAGIFSFVLWYARHEQSEQYTDYLIYFRESVAGLDEGGVVRYRGIKVGAVQRIEIDPANVEQTRVLIRLESNTPVKRDTRATLKFQGVTGIAYIELKGGTQSSEALNQADNGDIAVIPSEQSQFERVFESAPDLINNFAKVGMRASEALSEENIRAFSESLDHLRVVLASIARNSESIDTLIASSAGTMENINKAAMRMDRLSASLEAKVPLMVGAITDTSKEITGLVADNRKQIHEFSSYGLYDIRRLSIEVQRTAGEIRDLSQRLKDNPSQVIYGEKEKGFKTP